VDLFKGLISEDLSLAGMREGTRKIMRRRAVHRHHEQHILTPYFICWMALLTTTLDLNDYDQDQFFAQNFSIEG
jgi:truncated hemoglobin YjbI